jgi:hypothetical protein
VIDEGSARSRASVKMMATNTAMVKDQAICLPNALDLIPRMMRIYDSVVHSERGILIDST